MASQKDVQDLLRLLTTAPGRNKLPMISAMGRVKALQSAGLRSISDIAGSTLPTITSAISDESAAKYLLTACKKYLKSPSIVTPGTSKRPSDSSLSPSTKRLKSAYSLTDAPQTPQELEASLALPQPSADEEAISNTTIYTNRAPLVLAFAVQLLKYTMPEQPLSSRLSLAQAIVSANSKTKAVSLGLEKGKSAEELGWGMGQPKVKVMGREVSVLKRSGYEWKEDIAADSNEAETSNSANEEGEDARANGRGSVEGQATTNTASETGSKPPASSSGGGYSGWTVSAPISSKGSNFIARSITVGSTSQASTIIQTLLSNNPSLESATHNMTAYRIFSPSGSIIEQSNDDGETGGGRHLLSVLRSSNLTNVLLVVSRWYGGVFLGPDRWRIMTEVSQDALSQRLRVAGVIGQEALWGLDLEGMKSTDSAVVGDGLPIHKPNGARSYILKSFSSPPDTDVNKKKTAAVAEREKEENLGLLLGALDLLFKSWTGYIGREEMDRRAWGWYVQVRPEVESGVAGWGGKGVVNLRDILGLRRKG